MEGAIEAMDQLLLSTLGMGLKKTLLTAVNSAILAGAFLMKTPQVVKIARLSSVMGISESSIVMETLGSLGIALYSILSSFPFMAWGENLVVGTQNCVIVLLVWVLAKPPVNMTLRAAGAVAFASFCAAVLHFGLPPAQLNALGIFPIVVGNVAKVPQVWKNFQQGHTGTLSVVPSLLGTLGCGVRVVTTVLQTPEPVAVLNPAVAFVFWALLLLQILFYWKRTNRAVEAFLKEEAKKSQ